MTMLTLGILHLRWCNCRYRRVPVRREALEEQGEGEEALPSRLIPEVV